MANLLLRKDTICRTCLKEAIDSKSLLAKLHSDTRNLCEVLSFITNFDIIVNESYPKQICNQCYTLICKTDEFKKRCIQSEILLKNEVLNSTVLFNETIKQDLSADSSNVLPFQSLILNENSLLNLKQCSSQDVDNEIPLIENIDYSISNATDTLKIDGLNIIKEERDDFLQTDIEDLTNSIPIDKVQMPNKSPLNEITKVSICECGKECVNTEELESHIIECKNVSYIDYKVIAHCYNCKEEFESLDLLRTHIEIHHNKKEQDQCEKTLSHKIDFSDSETVCGQIEYLDTNKESSTSKILVPDKPLISQNRIDKEYHSCQYPKQESLKKVENRTEEKESFPISCPDCSWMLPDIKAFEKHLAKHKIIINKNFRCSKCAQTFFTRSLLIAHIKTHEIKESRYFICKTCKREFKHQAHLENHIEKAHTKVKGYKCDTCTKSFFNQESLECHKQQHINSRKYQCNMCSKTFAVQAVLNEHLRTHTGEKPFLCSICGRGFTQKTNLAQHMRRHQGLKPFKCNSCDGSFVTKGELDAHTRKHTGKHPFICDECGNSFTTSSSLTKHRRIHTGERPYACELCSMRFAVLGTLKNHRRTHTGEKPFQCSLCEKAFIQRQDLVGHIRCHTGERPFTCTSCGQGFRKSSALKVHLRSHGNDMLVM